MQSALQALEVTEGSLIKRTSAPMPSKPEIGLFWDAAIREAVLRINKVDPIFLEVKVEQKGGTAPKGFVLDIPRGFVTTQYFSIVSK